MTLQWWVESWVINFLRTRSFIALNATLHDPLCIENQDCLLPMIELSQLRITLCLAKNHPRMASKTNIV